MPSPKLCTRFAPSPTGLMHLGNAFSALQCQQWAFDNNASLLLRIEDIDFTRCRPQYTQQIIEDLQWLGITWHGEIRKQSQHLEIYQQALQKLRSMGVVYPCFCTRKHIQQKIEYMAAALHQDERLDFYPGICRQLQPDIQQQRMLTEPFAWRLHASKASAHITQSIFWCDHQQQQYIVKPKLLGDIIIARKDIGISYHLAVVVDDALQGISHIIRGEDLRSSTPIHCLLQTLLGLPSPYYHHHVLVQDHAGKRLAKRSQSPSLKSMREAGTPAASLKATLKSQFTGRK